MPAEVDRAAFLRMMGLTAADVADPDSVPTRTASRSDAPKPSSTNASLQHARLRKASPPAASSVGGLSHSASLRGDADNILKFTSTTTNATSSLNARDGDRVRRTVTPGSARSSSSINGDTTTAQRHSARSVSFEPHVASATAARGVGRASSSEVLKEEGNRAFEAGLFVEAIRHYSAAIDALNHPESLTSAGPATVHSRGGGGDDGATPSAEVALVAALHSNRSAAYLQAARQWSSAEEAFARALCDADRAVALRPSWFKGYARQGDAYFKLRRFGTAAESYEMALQLDPRNTTLSNALDETRLRAKQAAREEMEMRRSMRSTAHSHMSSTRSTDMSAEQSSPYAASSGTFTHPSSHAGSVQAASGGRRRSSVETQQLWADLKREVEGTAHAPTGDGYRLQQLERFRKRGGAAEAEAKQEARQTHTAERSERPARPAHEQQPHSQHSTSPMEEKTASPTPVVASAPLPPPRRSTYEAPTAGGITAAMANFSGPVTSARDVPYEFSSAAASAYQQQLLEAFRQRKGK